MPSAIVSTHFRGQLRADVHGSLIALSINCCPTSAAVFIKQSDVDSVSESKNETVLASSSSIVVLFNLTPYTTPLRGSRRYLVTHVGARSSSRVVNVSPSQIVVVGTSSHAVRRFIARSI